MENNYDSTKDTIKHIGRVRVLLTQACLELLMRAERHDLSKLKPPEKELFDTYTPKLKGSDYGSPEYNQFLKDLKPALDHHYKHNSHHPEHYKLWKCPICNKHKREEDTWKNEAGNRFCLDCSGGHAIYEAELTEKETIVSLDGMDLYDIIEMFLDWKAASERHETGDINDSIEKNKQRFAISDQLTNIFRNTAKRYF